MCSLQEEFTDNPMPGFADAGIIFVIHSPKKEPQFDGLGLSSPVGMHARVTMRQLKVRTWEMQRRERRLAGNECIKHANNLFNERPLTPMFLSYGRKGQHFVSDAFPLSGGSPVAKGSRFLCTT